MRDALPLCIMGISSLLEEPLVALFAPVGGLGSLCLSSPFVLCLAFWIFCLFKEPFIALLWGAMGGVIRRFSSFIYRVPLHRTTSVSGGGASAAADDMNDPIQIAREPPLVPPTLYKLY